MFFCPSYLIGNFRSTSKEGEQYTELHLRMHDLHTGMKFDNLSLDQSMEILGPSVVAQETEPDEPISFGTTCLAAQLGIRTYKPSSSQLSGA